MSSDDYEVGYGKPPKSTQFKKGRSGNRKGRPKGARNFKTDLEEVLSMKVTVNKDGGPVTVTAQQAALLRWMEKTLKGEPRLLMHMMSLASEHSAEKEAQSADRKLSASDEDIMRRLEEDMRRMVREENKKSSEGEGNNV